MLKGKPLLAMDITSLSDQCLLGHNEDMLSVNASQVSNTLIEHVNKTFRQNVFLFRQIITVQHPVLFKHSHCLV